MIIDDHYEIIKEKMEVPTPIGGEKWITAAAGSS